MDSIQRSQMVVILNWFKNNQEIIILIIFIILLIVGLNEYSYGTQKMNLKIETRIDHNGIEFECNPTGECWCKEVEYTSQIKLPIPNHGDNKLCYSPDELKKLINLINS